MSAMAPTMRASPRRRQSSSSTRRQRAKSWSPKPRRRRAREGLASPAFPCGPKTAAPSPNSPATRARSAERWSNDSPRSDTGADRAARHDAAVEDYGSLDHRTVEIERSVNDASPEISALGVGGRPRALPHRAVAINRLPAPRQHALAIELEAAVGEQHVVAGPELDDRAPLGVSEIEPAAGRQRGVVGESAIEEFGGERRILARERMHRRAG